LCYTLLTKIHAKITELKAFSNRYQLEKKLLILPLSIEGSDPTHPYSSNPANDISEKN